MNARHERQSSAACAACVALLVVGATVPSASEYGLYFSKNLNVWSWNHSIGVSRALGDRWAFVGSGDHERKLSDSPGFPRRSTRTRGEVRLSYAVNPKLSTALLLDVDRADVQTGAATSDVLSHRVRTSLTYRPAGGLTLTPSLGRAYDKRRDVSDAGTAYGLAVIARPFEGTLRRFGAALAADFSLDGVNSRQGDVARALSVSGTVKWAEGIAQSVRYTDKQDEQNYVGPTAESPILRRITVNRHFTSDVLVFVPLLGTVALEGGYTHGLVDDEASDDPNDLKHRTNNRTNGWTATTRWTLPFSRPVLSYVLDVGASDRKADPVPSANDSTLLLPNTLDQKNTNLNMSLSSAIAIGERDSVRVSGALGLQNSHTPAEAEVNDRDDYRRSLVVIYWHLFSLGTSLELRGERTETHQVWLRRQRSANNKWDRVFNFWATTRVPVGRGTFTQQGFFRTALEEYDFDYLTPENPRSRNSRIGRLEFAWDQPVGTAGGIALSYSAEARTLGTLLPAGEGKRPTVWQLTQNDLIHVLTFGMKAAIGSSWRFEPSVSLNRQAEYEPMQTTWNPLNLGRRSDKQDGMHVETVVSYAPVNGILGDGDAITVKMSRTYRRRTGISDTMSYVSIVYQHTF